MCAPWIRPKLPFFFCTETWFCGCAFRKVWEQVIAVGLYQQYGWTLKMDRVIEAWYVTYDSNSLVFLWFVPLISNEWTCRTQRLHFYLLDSKMYCQCHRIPSNCMQLLCWFADYQCLLTLDWIQRTPHCSTPWSCLPVLKASVCWTEKKCISSSIGQVAKQSFWQLATGRCSVRMLRKTWQTWAKAAAHVRFFDSLLISSK